MKVLLVDDSETEIRMMREVLRECRSRIELTAARSVRSARELLPQNEFELLLLDLGLPGENSIEFIRELKAHADWKKLPVIIWTGSNDSEEAKACYAAGASGFVTKPISFERYFDVIAELEGRA